MSQSPYDQKPTSPATRSATPGSQVEVQSEGLWMKGKRKADHKKDSCEKDPSTSLRSGHGIPSNEHSAAAPSDIDETVSRRSPSMEDLEKARDGLVSEVQKLGLRNDETHRNPVDAINKLEDAGTEEIVQYFDSSNYAMGIWDISKDVPASSVLEMWTEEDLLKWGVGEGMDINDHLPPITNYVSVEDVEETAGTNKLQSDTGHVSSVTVEVSGSLPPPLSAVGTPTVAESHTLPLAETKDTAATGATDVDPPCSRKIPSASERPESSFALRDVSIKNVSIIPWTDCYPDDPDTARELATSTGVPGLQIYSVDIFTHATSDTQVLNEVEATQESDNLGIEMGKQISPGRPLVCGTEKLYDKFEAKSSAETWDTDVDFDLNEGSRKMTGEDLARLDLQGWWKEDLSDVTTGLPLISKEDLPGLENVCEESLFSVGGPAAEDSGENVAENKTGIDRGRPRPPTANASSLLEMKVDSSIDFFGTTNRQASPGHTLPSVSPDWQPPKTTQEPQPNDSVRASSVTDSERADGSGWVKVEIETENPGQTVNV